MELDKKKMLDDIITEHMNLVNINANKLKSQGKIPNHMRTDDLLDAGVEGLLHAVVNYDDYKAKSRAKNPNANHFANYASGWIRGKMHEKLGQQHEVPQYFRRLASNLKAKAPDAAPKQEVAEEPTSPQLKNPQDPS
jgi:DNA-directed RNA polymerase specialized sigma subunit